ncbi:MAG: redoxin family protein [Acidobacteriota bacterium]
MNRLAHRNHGRRAGRLLASLASFAIAASSIVVTAGQAPAQPAPAAGRGIQPNLEHPILAIGSPAPDFSLPGVDGKVHKLAEYAGSKVLAIVFECNHCPVSQLYESRIEKLYRDYKAKGVTFVAINPNNPKSIRLNELGYTDVTDSLEEMKIRTAFRHIDWPYLYDGETQGVSIKFGVVATPHIYLFDKDRKLQYQGRIDDNQREDLVKSQDARKAIDAMLAGETVPLTTTHAFGCTTKWMSKATGVEEEWAKIQAEPVTVDLVDADDLKKLRANGTGKVLLVSFWSTQCATCVSQFTDLQTTFRMYRLRSFDFVTVSTDSTSKNAEVLPFLKKQYASSANKQFATDDLASLQSAIGATWNPGSAFTMVIAPDGKVLYQKEGKFDILELRRTILANMPDSKSYVGQQAYWQAAVAAKRKK